MIKQILVTIGLTVLVIFLGKWVVVLSEADTAKDKSIQQKALTLCQEKGYDGVMFYGEDVVCSYKINQQ